MSFPEGYETKVGELGVRLSGGEKQRVPMAGTFLKVTRDKVCLKHCRSFLLQDAPILALDEAISWASPCIESQSVTDVTILHRSLDTGTGKGDSESAPGTGTLAQIVNHDGENNSPLSQLHGKSSITIAHRVSAIVSADCILVLKDGGMVESGSHDSLLAKHGVFAAMWAKQVTKEYDEPTWKPMPDSAPGRRHEA
ncbi:hypothetical protein FRB98_002767 [Tulasnella sp. 332]|nr:hypothetical protein FRB98_002767 [Tulasnella sp. 332]